MRNFNKLWLLLAVALGSISDAHANGHTEATKDLLSSYAPDPLKRSSRYSTRRTTAQNATGTEFYVGAAEAGANEYSITKLTIVSEAIVKTPLAPLSVYSDPDNTESDLTTNLYSYNKVVWDMVYFAQGAKKYLAAIVKNQDDNTNGGSFIVVVNVADPKEMYVSPIAMSLEHEVDNADSPISRYVKLAVGTLTTDNTVSVIFAAVGDPTSGDFDTSKSTVGIRAFRVPASPTNNDLTELDINGAGTFRKGVSLGANTAIMSTKMRSLTSMEWLPGQAAGDGRLYLAGYMSDKTIGLTLFKLAASTNVLTSCNDSTTGTIFKDTSAGDEIVPEMSRIHNIIPVATTNGGGTLYHMIIHAGTKQIDRNKIYALKLFTDTGDSDNGKLRAPNAIYSVAQNRDDTWLKLNGSTGQYSTNDTNGNGKLLVGRGALPIPANSFVTGIQYVNGKVYASVYNATSGSELWVSQATIDGDGELDASSGWAWTAWQKINDNTNLNHLNAFAVTSSKLWALRDLRKVWYTDAIPSGATPTTSTMTLNNASIRARLRQLGLFDDVAKRFIIGESNALEGVINVRNYSLAGNSYADATSSELLNSVPVWDMAIQRNAAGTTDLFVLANTEFGQSNKAGGKSLVKLASDGSVAAHIDSTNNVALFKDNAADDSRMVKIVAGTKPDGTRILFTFIPEAGTADANVFSHGTRANDVIRVLNAVDLSSADASATYGAALEIGVNDLNIDHMECAFWDQTLERLYVGGAKGSGTDAGVSMYYFNGDSLTTPGRFVTSNPGYTDFLQIATMHLPGVSMMIVNGANNANDTGNIYALPLVRSGTDKGKVAVAGNYSLGNTAANSSTAYNPISPSSNAETWRTTGTFASLAIVGGTIPWNAKAVITDLKTYGNAVFVGVINPLGVDGVQGVFYTKALTNSSGDITGWTPWKKYAALQSGTQELALDIATGGIIGMEYDSSQALATRWQEPGKRSAFDYLADALNEDFAGKGGIYNIASHVITDGTNTANLIVATGNKKAALAHVEYSNPTVGDQYYNPRKSNVHGYKLFDNDGGLNSLNNVYCSAASRGATGWLFAGGHKGLSVLRLSNGTGWDSAVPAEMLTPDSAGLADMTWKKLDDITAPIYKMFTILDKTSGNEYVVALSSKKIYAFQTAASKFKTTSPDPLDLITFDMSSVTPANGTNRFIYDGAVVAYGKGIFMVSTNAGLFRMKLDDGEISKVTEVLNADERSLGTVRSVHVVAPTSVAGWYAINCLVGKTVQNSSTHLRVNLQLDATGDNVGGEPTATIVKAIAGLKTGIIDDGAITYYLASGASYGVAASLHALEKANESNGSVSNAGLSATGRESLGAMAIANSSGARLISVGGKVYVHSATV